ncbi:MAG: 4-(cytidine 5'-diphospho)-2-C-methyl-D-erythritol kinase [Confluentimicrobium sp.]|nr:4-(cytidine 5'-diphospho)-2-C-methyl-D-erythritol kinase [Actibacterium sp.]
MTATATGFAPAKINLALHVTGRRADGYHLLDSLVVFGRAGDRLVLRGAPGLSLGVEGPFADRIPAGAENLVLRAMEVMRRETGAQGQGASVTLTKRLPPGSGIGGGSSDAAAALRGLAQLWDMDLPGPKALLALGADVPVCMDPRPQRMRGVGERLNPVTGLPDLPLLLVNPGVPVATPAVFTALTERDGAPMEPLPDAPDLPRFVEWLARQRNDLQPPAMALVPEIGTVLARMKASAGCLLARMSGSGATCFAIYRDTDMRDAAAAEIRAAAPPAWWVAEA